jgi:hypothetical protein
MPYTNNAQAELQAVNEILASIGQAPVTTIEAQTITYEDGSTVEAVINPEVAIAYETLMQVSREVQAEGWTFNREVEYPFTPDTNGYLSMTGSMLQIDLSDSVANSSYDTVIRNGRLYDKIGHTDVWDTTKTYDVDVVWYYDFVDLPQVFRDYITARAATRCAIRLVGVALTALSMSATKATTLCLVSNKVMGSTIAINHSRLLHDDFSISTYT